MKQASSEDMTGLKEKKKWLFKWLGSDHENQ